MAETGGFAEILGVGNCDGDGNIFTVPLVIVAVRKLVCGA